MSDNQDYSNAAISALYGTTPSAKPDVAISARAPKIKSHHALYNRHQNNFEKRSPINMYGLIFAACATITTLLYLVSK